MLPKVLDAWFSGRATNAMTLGYTRPGDRVLEVGCGKGETLQILTELLQIEPHGLEVSEWCCEQTLQTGIPCEVAELSQWDLGAKCFEQVQLFHFLQRVPRPLELLLAVRDALVDGGRVILEVPNLYRPYGLLEENFLRRTDVVAFSESTLPALLRRAGFAVERVVSSSSLFVVGRKATLTGEGAKPFSTSLLQYPAQDVEWVRSRLASYADMEKTRIEVRRVGPSMDLIHKVVQLLTRPAFTTHLADSVLDLIDFFLGHDARGLACLVATAAAEGPYEPALTARFARLAGAIRSDGPAVGTTDHLVNQASVSADQSIEDLVDEIRSQLDVDLPVMSIEGALKLGRPTLSVAQA